LASIELFNKAGMQMLRDKSLLLTGYLEFIVQSIGRDRIQIITPSNPIERGCQLSLVINKGKKIFDSITSNGVYVDWREPDVIRAAPVPMYNTFEDVFLFGKYLKSALENE
jgi:kynureninase